MYITIHCGGMPFDGSTFKEQGLGGSESAAYYLARELAKTSHKVVMFTNTSQEGTWDGVKYCPMGPVSNEYPLGVGFHHYAANVPCDVLIVQRQPQAFAFKWASKVNVLWLHDLAMARFAPQAQAQLWNIDATMVVSEFHKNQVAETWGWPKENLHVVPNGVDASLFVGKYDKRITRRNPAHPVFDAPSDQIKLVYSSRPERGLINHVKPGGIMERLAEIDPRYHLYVCGYDNVVPQMRQQYEALFYRCEALPNVTVLGSLSKQQLADMMRDCDAVVYPTSFHDTSCIVAMEAMHAGIPFISSDVAALPETCKDSGSILLPLGPGMMRRNSVTTYKKLGVDEALDVSSENDEDVETEQGITTGILYNIEDDQVNVDLFVDAITNLFDRENISVLQEVRARQISAADSRTWQKSGECAEALLKFCFSKHRKSAGALSRHFINQSDVYVARKLLSDVEDSDDITSGVRRELETCYGFMDAHSWRDHYGRYYEYEARKGVVYGPEDLSGNGRFESVAARVASLPPGSRILDYGCAHGHYSINLAKRFQDKFFYGVDIAQSNIDTALKWKDSDGVENVEFYCAEVGQEEFDALPLDHVNAVIIAEVLEHVPRPAELMQALYNKLSNNGMAVITTPYGPWEFEGYEKEHPWRAHVRHFEREDLDRMFSHHKEFKIFAVPAGVGKHGDPIGSYVTVFNKSKGESEAVRYSDDSMEHILQKIVMSAPRETVSLCMIAKDAEASILRALRSCADVVDEVIVGIDATTTDDTESVITSFALEHPLWPVVKTKTIPNVVKTGFDESRNSVITDASGDWILWLDADEELIHASNLPRYLRNNNVLAYAIRQHHFSVEPLGVMRTDHPAKLFRNHRGIKFYGVVHEHPETAIGEGVGAAVILPDVEIAHGGYTTESIRRDRFKRNIGLMVRDRKKYPQRVLGKALWIRDLSYLCQFDLEAYGGPVPETLEFANLGIELWEELLIKDEKVRLAVDALQFYSLLAKIAGNGFEMGFMLDTSKQNPEVHPERQHPVVAYYASQEHARLLLDSVFEERTNAYENRYY